MNSINYYIQLSDELSTAIDAMSKEELISLAQQALYYRDTYKNIDSSLVTLTQATLCMNFVNGYEMEGVECIDKLTTFAHGLLAKAL